MKGSESFGFNGTFASLWKKQYYFDLAKMNGCLTAKDVKGLKRGFGRLEVSIQVYPFFALQGIKSNELKLKNGYGRRNSDGFVSDVFGFD